MKTARASTLAAPADVEAVDVKRSARADAAAKGKEEAAAATPDLTTAILLSSAGNVLEWMDFSIYAFMAKQIGKAFFPPAKEEAQLIESFSVFAAAFFARPLGGVIFGWIGDRRSKQFALQLSLFLMALSTTLMGCLPTYAQIGRAAPVLLIILRMLQGLAVGGQLVGTWIFVHGHAPAGKRGFYGGLVLSGVVLGVLLGAVVATILRETLSPEDLQRFGFRIPFLCGFLVAVAGLALHKYVPDMSAVEAETGPANEDAISGKNHSDEPVPSLRASMAAQSSGAGSDAASPSASAPPAEVKPNPLKELFANYKLELFMGMPVLFLYCNGFYECLVWLATYMTTLVPHAPIKGAFPINTVNLALAILLFPVSGHLADRFGYYPVMLAGGLFMGATAPLAFYIIRLGHPVAAFFGQLIFVMFFTTHSGPLGLFMTEHMTTCPHLYTAMALSYNLGMALLGGSAAVVSTAFVKTLHGYGAAVWLSSIALIACSALVIGYHPTMGIVTKARNARRVGSGGKGDVEMASAGESEEKGGSM